MSESVKKSERLQKAIARLGIASRRHAEELITKGLVKVNGEIVSELGTKVTESDMIEVDGNTVSPNQQDNYVYFLLHKPEGVITSVTDPRKRKTVIDIISRDIKVRVFPVGRLDYDTSGLLLLTNDGDLTYRLTHPRYGVDKTYRAMLKGTISQEALSTLQKGVMLDDGLTAPAKITRVESINKGNVLTIVEITIHEGKNRQVRRMFENVGYPLVSLQRIAFGPLKLDVSMKPGDYRTLSRNEIESLRNVVGLT